MAKVKFYSAGDHTSKARLKDTFLCKVWSERFYTSTENLFICHRNRYTTIFYIDSDLFKKYYKYDRKSGRYTLINSYLADHQLAQIKTELLEH